MTSKPKILLCSALLLPIPMLSEASGPGEVHPEEINAEQVEQHRSYVNSKEKDADSPDDHVGSASGGAHLFVNEFQKEIEGRPVLEGFQAFESETEAELEVQISTHRTKEDFEVLHKLLEIERQLQTSDSPDSLCPIWLALLTNLKGEETREIVTRIRAYHDAEKRKRISIEEQLVSLKNEADESTRRRQKNLISSGLCVVGLTSILLTMAYRKIDEQSAESQKQQNALEMSHLKNQLLFKELNHRTKNNFNLFKKFIRASVPDYKENERALDILSRVDSMSMLHEQMYRQESTSQVDFELYLLKMAQRLEMLNDQDIEMEIQCRLRPDPSTALQLGMIMNEILTNSFKYAFSRTRHPKIVVRCSKGLKGLQVVEIEDNGCGYNLETTKTGFGHQLIDRMCTQLGGVHNIRSSKKGTTHTLTLSI